MSEKKKPDKRKKVEIISSLGQKKEKPAPEGKGEYKEEEKTASAKASRQEENKDQEHVKKNHNLQFIIFTGVILITFLAIVLIPRYVQKTTFENNKYNSFDFVKDSDGHWNTVVQKGNQPYHIPFYYHPKELEDIPVEANLRDKFFNIRDNNGSIFITLDPDSKNNTVVIAGVEIAKITGTGYGLLNVPTHSAFIKEPTASTADTGTPIVTCNDANAKIMVIWLTLSNKNIAYSYGNCIILEAKGYADMIRVADRLVYHLLGIMSD